MDKDFLSGYIDRNFDEAFWERIAKKVGVSLEEVKVRGKAYLMLWGEPTDDVDIKDAIILAIREDFFEACEKTIIELRTMKKALDG